MAMAAINLFCLSVNKNVRCLSYWRDYCPGAPLLCDEGMMHILILRYSERILSICL